MRIVGGRDYYDSALAFGHDAHTTYVRGQEMLGVVEAEQLGISQADDLHFRPPAKGKKLLRRYHWRWGGEFGYGDRRYRPDVVTVIACGKVYAGIRVLVAGAFDYRIQEEVNFFWRADKLESWLEEHELEANLPPRIESLAGYFQPKPLGKDALDAVVEQRWTLLVWDPVDHHHDGKAVWKVDQPCLKAVEFYRAVPPHLLFQEIDLWVGGVLPAPGRTTVEISDEVRAAKHGMDKTSFRRPKQAKK